MPDCILTEEDRDIYRCKGLDQLFPILVGGRDTDGEHDPCVTSNQHWVTYTYKYNKLRDTTITKQEIKYISRSQERQSAQFIMCPNCQVTTKLMHVHKFLCIIMHDIFAKTNIYHLKNNNCPHAFIASFLTVSTSYADQL